MTIRIELESDSVLNAEHVRGRAEWVSGGKEPRKIEVACRWRVAGKANKTQNSIDMRIEENIASRTQITIPFDFQIPLTGPLSYEGKLFNIIWEIFVNVDLPFAFDEEETKVFTVRPRPYDKKEFERIENEEDQQEGEEEGA